MHQPDKEAIFQSLFARLTLPPPVKKTGEQLYGKIVKVSPTLLRASLPGVSLSELCRLEPCNIEAEVIAIEGQYAVLSPFAEPFGVTTGSKVISTGKVHQICLGNFLLGHIVDGLGRPMDNLCFPEFCDRRGLESPAPNPLTRQIIDTPLPLGVRAIDGLLTCGVGQRIGIFAAAGGGKSTLLEMICDGTPSDVIILALIGERGREAREFLEHKCSKKTRMRSVVVLATSDRPALERQKAAYTATTIAEYFRDQGKNVLLLMDSLTRFARASREIGGAAGEPIGLGGYPSSFFARLPRLLERAGPSEIGSITGIYTVLVEGDNLNEPVSDEVRSILDGHIVLSRKLAQESHYPAIDIAASVSRLMRQIATPKHLHDAEKLRNLMEKWKEIELLVRVGEYQQGQDKDFDEAILKKELIRDFLCQSITEKSSFEETLERLCQTLS